MHQDIARLSRRTILVGLAQCAAGSAGLVAPAAGDRRRRVLTAAPARVALPEGATASLAFDGMVPGPTIRVQEGEAASVRLVNRLDQPMGLRWQGLRAPEADGAEVPAGGTLDSDFTAGEPGLSIYRPCGSAEANRQADAGLAGVLVVEEARPPFDRDIVLALQRWPQPAQPTVLTVNGRVQETIAIRRNERVRLRFANLASAEAAILVFVGIDPLVVAFDGAPVDTPFAPERHRLDLPPGSRADAIVDGVLAPDVPAGIVLSDGTAMAEIVHFTAAPGDALRRERLPRPKPLPSRLPKAIDLATAARATLAIDAVASQALPPRPLLSVRRGRPVQLALANQTDVAHSVHVQGHAVRLLHALDDGWDPYWLDTLLVDGGQTAQVAFVASNPGRWALDAQAIGRPDLFRAAWFEVT